MRTGTFLLALAAAAAAGAAIPLLAGGRPDPGPPAPVSIPDGVRPVREDVGARLAEAEAALEAARAEGDRLRKELERLRGERPGPTAPDSVEGFWYHSVDGGPSTLVELLPRGRLVGPTAEGSWTMEGWRLRLEWPDARAPGGSWVDECVVAADGRSYAGRNQDGAVIRGTRRPE